MRTLWILPAAALALAGCGGDEPAPATLATTVPIVAHGDHSPHHGGVVMMKGDLHYEVVLDPAGRHRLYFSDATRADLPAATARTASIRVMRPDAAEEVVDLRIDDAGESWVGEGQPISEPGLTSVRVAFTIGAEPYWIDLPFQSAPADPNAPDPHAERSP